MGTSGARVAINPGIKAVVDRIDPGTPADGKLKKGNRIIQVNGQVLDGPDPRVMFGQALTEAEAGNEMRFTVERGGQRRVVALEVPVLGPYAETWPLSYKKSEKIIRDHAQHIAGLQGEDGWFTDSGKGRLEQCMAALFLLSTADPAYDDHTRRFAHVLAASIEAKPNSSTWHTGYQIIYLSEYYLRNLDYIMVYNLPEEGGELRHWDWKVEQPFNLANRKGILTHPAWLWSFSTNFDNDPIHRGKWIQERLLAGVVQDVPPDVDARLPEDPTHTLRQRLAVTEVPACYRCHVKMNPLGTPFEMYNDFGQYRTEHAFHTETGELITRRDRAFERLKELGKIRFQPIDTSGYLQGTGDPKLDGPVEDAYDLIERLAESDRVRQSIIRHLFRYFMGRNEMLSDSVTLMEADRAYVESGGSFRALVASLLSSDSFVYRK